MPGARQQQRSGGSRRRLLCGTPKTVMLEQLAWLGKEVMPEFVNR
jgi:hypothetical protein